MKHIFTSVLVAFCTLPIMSQEVCFEADFYEFPEGMTIVSYDEIPVKTQDFKKITLSKEWTIAAVDSEDGLAAVSTSRRSYDFPTDNWMITPRLTLPLEGACLKWTSRSIHYQLRDGYKVMISTTGNEYYDFEELYSVDAEKYLWTKHYVSLEKYAGKKVYIAFVHNSKDKFLLAIDDIFVGQPSKAEFIANDSTRLFAGNVGCVPVKGCAVNSGVSLNEATLTCVVNDTLTLVQENSLAIWPGGVEQEYYFDVPVKVGKTTHYKVMAGNNVVVQDSIICSYYPRTIFLEKATGAWCVNCPEVIPFIHELQERYGESLVHVEAHAHYGDIFEYMPYVTGMKTQSFPTIHINRDRYNPIYGGSPAQSMSKFKKLLTKPTVAKVEMDVTYEGGDSIQTTSRVTFANDTDNSTGKYRIGYVLVEKGLQTDSMGQINGVVNISQGEFYYLVSPVPSELMFYENVVRNDNNAFIGCKNSLPSTIKGGVEYTFDAKMGIPSKVYDRNNLAIIAIVMNYYTDEVLNVVEVDVPEDPTSIRPTTNTELRPDVHLSLDKGTLVASSATDMPFTIELLSVDGRHVATSAGSGHVSVSLSSSITKGVYLIRISQNGYIVTRKVVL